MNRIKKEFKKIKDRIYNEKTDPDLTIWAIFGFLATFIFICFIYWDILVTTSHTTNFIEAIASGRPQDLYKINYNLKVQGTLSNVCYDIPIYFIFMIWDFPLWILQHFYKVKIIENFLCMIWMKGILILFLVLCCKVLKKICQEIGFRKTSIKWILLIFLSSPIVLYSLLMLCQYDIIPIFFMLLGILAYIKGDEKRFIIWFAIAIPMKLFSLFVFIPLLLLKEKQVLNIILKFFASISILYIFRMIATRMPFYKASTEAFNSAMLNRLLNTSVLKINLGNSSLFIAAYAILCIYCYIKEIKNKEELYKYSIYIPFATFIIFFLFVQYHPYWLIYLTPFFPILLFKNSKYFRVNLLIEMVFNFIIIFIVSNNFPWCFGAKQINGMLISKIFGIKELANLKFQNLANIYNYFGFNIYLPALYGMFLAISICLIIINAPKLNTKKGKIEIERSTIVLRMLLIVPLVTLMIYCYFS